jgi:3-oxoacid CoA-transferase A subunit/3-oxoacid CoA-transferase B subunit
MPQAERLTHSAMARRVAQSLDPGSTVTLGSGLPALLAEHLSADYGILVLYESGALGYPCNRSNSLGPDSLVDSNGYGTSLQPGNSVNSLVDVAAMIRGGHVDVAVVQTAQVSARGDFSHWTTAATPGLFAPGTALDLAAAGRVVALMSHTNADGNSNLLDQCSIPVDGVGCVDQIASDIAVVNVTNQGFVLTEVAPGWRADDVIALTQAPLKVSPDLREMTFDSGLDHARQKVYPSGLEALGDLPNGATVMIDGFAGPGGMPHYLLVSLRDHGATDLTIISNTAGIARVVNFGTPPGKQAIDHTILIDNKQVKKAIASYPVSPSASRPSAFELAYRRGEVELELVPQGTLAERLRAGGAGIAAFYTPTGVGTLISEGKETRVINGREYLLEHGLRADFCLIRGHKADTLGNVVYKGTSRNFNAVMAPAAEVTIIEVDEIVEPGVLGPEEIVTPGIYVDRVVKRPVEFSPYE